MVILPAVGLVRGQRCSTQAALPLVGLAADKSIRDRHTFIATNASSPNPWMPHVLPV
ncbi:MAG: hypothetical protein R6U98_20740 [Pirellulaceae bacterium]